MTPVRRIATIQAGLREVGRIRMGVQVKAANGKLHPAKLTTFRLTSRSRPALDRAAEEYGGTVTPWPESPDPAEHWQVTIDSPFLDVLVPPNGYESAFELWSGGGCLRRCDGIREELSGQDCLCPEDPRQRMALAAKGEACKPTSRLRVLLPKIPELGAWRLESHGYYAAVELSGMADFLAQAAMKGYAIPARLRIEERRTTRPNEPRRDYVVPVLEIPDLTPGQMLPEAHVPERPQLTAGEPVIPRAEPPEARPFSEGEMSLAEIQRAALDHGVTVVTLNSWANDTFNRTIAQLTDLERYALAQKAGILP